MKLSHRGVAVLLTGVLVAVGAVVVVPRPAEAAARKVTLCHRTRAVNNPYRRITVNFTAANGPANGSDHQGHAKGDATDTGPFDPSIHNSSNKTWGDIIPGEDVHGLNQVDAANWTERGQAIYEGTGTAAGLCGKMSAARFLELATDATDGWLTEAQALAELDEMADNEDKILLAELGTASFAAVSDITTLRSVALSVTTADATSVTSSSAVLNGSHVMGSQDADASFQYGTDATCSTGSTVAASTPSVTGSATMSASLSSLDAGTYYYKAMATIDAGTDDEAVFEGSCVSFTISASSSSSSTVPDSSPDDESSGETSSGGSTSGGSSGGSTSGGTSSGGSTSGGSSAGSGTSSPSAPGAAGPQGRPTGTTEVTKSLSLSKEKNTGSGSGGSLSIEPGASGPGVELQSATTNDPNVEVTVTASGSDYNKPETWVAEGFGDVCWKIEPFGDGDYVYMLPDSPTPPSGDASGMTYSMVKVKAGSIRSTDPDFQVNTIFASPSGGTGVFADSNKSGTSDPGGQSGDKSISHVIVCVWVDGPPETSTTSSPATSSPETSAPETSSTDAPTTTEAGASSTSSTAAPTTAAPTTATPSTAPPTPKPPVIVTLRLRPEASTTTQAPTTTGAPDATTTTVAGDTTTTTDAGDTSTTVAGDTTTTTVAGETSTTQAPAETTTTEAPTATLSPPTREGTSKVVLLLSTGTETVQVELEVDMASFEIVSSPVPEVVLPATGGIDINTGLLAITLAATGWMAVLISRRRRLV